MRGWRAQPTHFTERHGPTVIIAIGESSIAIGLGEDISRISTEVTVAGVLGLARVRDPLVPRARAQTRALRKSGS